LELEVATDQGLAGVPNVLACGFLQACTRLNLAQMADVVACRDVAVPPDEGVALDLVIRARQCRVVAGALHAALGQDVAARLERGVGRCAARGVVADQDVGGFNVLRRLQVQMATRDDAGGANVACLAGDLPIQADVFGLDLHSVGGLGAALDVEILSGMFLTTALAAPCPRTPAACAAGILAHCHQATTAFVENDEVGLAVHKVFFPKPAAQSASGRGNACVSGSFCSKSRSSIGPKSAETLLETSL